MLRRVSLLAVILLCLATSGGSPWPPAGGQSSPSRIRRAGSVLALTLADRVEALLAQTPPAIIEAFLAVERDRTLNFAKTNPIKPSSAENLPPSQALPNIQHGIDPNEAVLSFYFDTQSSYLWAFTQEIFEFHHLTAPTQLVALALEFRQAVESSSPSSVVLGQRLYHELFGEVSAGVRRKPQWLVTADDTLFNVPFPALVAGIQKGHPVYLVEEHSTQRIPSALTLQAAPQKATTGAFLGIGDGIYNTADPRWTSRHAPTARELDDAALQLPRLPASEREITACAREWHSNTNDLLTGLNASRATFLARLATTQPRVIHIAAHVIEPNDSPEQALVYLGLASNGSEETLTQDVIAKLNVSGSTVVMSGCSSAGLVPVSGAAIEGLSRAWLTAGARAVVGSRWPTPDDTGELFQVFYRDLRDRCARGADGRVIGASLQTAQLAMLRSTSWRSNPNYWGAFYVVGKE